MKTSGWGRLRRPVIIVVFGVMAPAAGYLALKDSSAPARAPFHLPPTAAVGVHDQLVLVLVTASFCPSARDPDLRSRLVDAMDSLPSMLPEGTALWKIGVALDWSPSDGVSVLERFGRFDEMIVGGNWTNVGALRHIWSDAPGSVAVLPQVILLRRVVAVGERSIMVVREEELERFAGTAALVAWTGRSELLPRSLSDSLDVPE